MDLKEIDRQEKIQAEILHSFHQTLKNEEFQIYFQPKVSPASGKISSAEVLVRWLHGGKMRWSPAVYIPLFEQNGFVISLDYYVYEKTFRWLQEFSRHGKIQGFLYYRPMCEEDFEKLIHTPAA